MQRRWNDRIEIHVPSQPTYDAWGHLQPVIYQPNTELWADVQPALGAVRSAKVTVRAPFQQDETVRIKWCHLMWRITTPPVEYPGTGIVQFKIEQL